MPSQQLNVKVIRTTDKAIHCEYMGAKAWIPKSQIEKMTDQDDGSAELMIPEWLVEKFE